MLQPSEYQGLTISPSEMLSNDGHMTPCAKLSALPDRVFKIAIQVPKAYIYPLFGHQAEVSYKVGKGGYNIEMYFSFLPA